MDRIRALIIDDEPLARQRVRGLLEREPDVEIAGECIDGVDAVEAIRSLHPDLIFLDVQMPEVDGFAVLERLTPDEMPLVIFVTAFDEHAVRAFEAHALDYLLKPFEDDRFREALRRAQSRPERKEDAVRRVMEMLEDVGGVRDGVKRIMIKTGGHITFLRSAEVEWVEAQGDYVSLHSQGKKHLIRENIGDMERQLSPASFVRIHRSTIVNVARIKELQPLFHGDYQVILQDGTRLTMSRSFRERFFQRVPAVP
jgi:two-component system, LytTR family, response regulator